MRMMPYIYWLGNGYKVRRRIPVELQTILSGEFMIKSLRTRNAAVANRRGVPLIIAIEELFVRVRNMIGEVDHETAQQIAENWKRQALNQDFDDRLSGKQRSKHGGNDIQTLHHALHQMDFLGQAEFIDSVSQQYDLNLQTGSENWRRFGYHLGKARIDYLKEIDRRDHDPCHVIDYLSPLPQTLTVKKAVYPTLSESLKKWEEEQPRPQKTLLDWREGVRRFIELKGDQSISEIKKNDVWDFLEACKQVPMPLSQADRNLTLPQILKKFHAWNGRKVSPKTVNKKLTAVRSVIKAGMKGTDLEANPADGVSMKVSKKKVRRPFDETDLQRIFMESPVYQSGARPEGGAGEAAYWLPVLALYQGARQEELGQLLLSDVKEKNGILYLDINDADDSQHLKNENSKRRVPIHHQVLELGFERYCEELGRLKHRHLFPRLHHESEICTDNYSKWINRYLKNICAITDKGKVFHSFRHTFIDACRDNGVPKSIARSLTGHAGQDEHDEYGHGYSLSVLHENINKVAYHHLKISPWR